MGMNGLFLYVGGSLTAKPKVVALALRVRFPPFNPKNFLKFFKKKC